MLTSADGPRGQISPLATQTNFHENRGKDEMPLRDLCARAEGKSESIYLQIQGLVLVSMSISPGVCLRPSKKPSASTNLGST